MKKIVAVLCSVLLCVQPVYAMQVREPILYTDTGTQEQEDADAREEEETQGEANVQEEAETGTQE